MVSPRTIEPIPNKAPIPVGDKYIESTVITLETAVPFEISYGFLAYPTYFKLKVRRYRVPVYVGPP